MQPISGSIDQGESFPTPGWIICSTAHLRCSCSRTQSSGVFDKEFGSLYVEKVGRPGLPIRLVVALLYLKHAFNASLRSRINNRKIISLSSNSLLSLIISAKHDGMISVLFRWLNTKKSSIS